jgi:hypothetical protein
MRLALELAAANRATVGTARGTSLTSHSGTCWRTARLPGHRVHVDSGAMRKRRPGLMSTIVQLYRGLDRSHQCGFSSALVRSFVFCAVLCLDASRWREIPVQAVYLHTCILLAGSGTNLPPVNSGHRVKNGNPSSEDPITMTTRCTTVQVNTHAL